MKVHVVQNVERTRKAVVEGRKVKFFIRKPSKEHFVSPRQFWHRHCASFDAAKVAAELWAVEGVMQ